MWEICPFSVCLLSLINYWPTIRSKCKNENVLKASLGAMGIPGPCFENHCIIIFLRYLWLPKKISPRIFSSSLCVKVHSFAFIFQVTSRMRFLLPPKIPVAIEGKKRIMDKGNVSSTPPRYFSSWEGKEREIKFNEHFYYVPGALHMLFQFNPQNNPRRYY